MGMTKTVMIMVMVMFMIITIESFLHTPSPYRERLHRCSRCSMGLWGDSIANLHSIAKIAASTAVLLTSFSSQPAMAVGETVHLPSGVDYYDVIEGDGDKVEEGKSVQFLWVLRRANGYFVDSSKRYGDEPFIYRVGNKQKVIEGLDEGIRGMRSGGVRRIDTPSEVSFVQGVDEGSPGPLPEDFGAKRQILSHQDHTIWKWEVKVVKVK